MTNLLYLIPLALFLGRLGLAAFAWSLHSGQYDDLDGAAHRVLLDDDVGPDPVWRPSGARLRTARDQRMPHPAR